MSKTKAAVVAPVAPVLVSFDTGTKCIATIPLTGTDDDGNTVSVMQDGAVVTVDLYWPDHPTVIRARLLFRNTLARLQSLSADTSDEARVDAELAMDSAFSAYMAAVVHAWSVDVPLTRETVMDLFTRAPFVRDIIAVALGDAERFLPASLRTSARASPPPSEAVVA